MPEDKVIEAIKKEIEDLLSAKRSSTEVGLAKDISPGIAGTSAGGLEWLLEELAAQARVDVNSVPVRSTRPVWGPLITLFKRAVRKSTYWLYQPLFEQVSGFNSALLALLTEAVSRKGAIQGAETGWAGFYKKNVTEGDLQANIDHHAFFIQKIEETALKESEGAPSLLEVGIGTATMSIYFSRKLFNVVGIDNDPLIIAKAIRTNKSLGGYATFICMDATLLAEYFKPGIFDIAFSQGTLEHFDNKTLVLILKSQLSVAKHVIFSVPSTYWPQRDFGNERRMTVEEWRRILEAQGFKIAEISYYPEDEKYHVYCCISGKQTSC
ncbi:MAG: class I SAM-dependent methyltransferase [Bacillota bacterium]